MESRVLEAIRIGEKIPMRQVVKAVKASYGAKPPNKTTIWRCIKRLQGEGGLVVQPKKVVREFTEYLLSSPHPPALDFDKMFSGSLLGEKLRVAVEARKLIKSMPLTAPAISPTEALSKRTEGELAALAETAKIGFEKLFEPLGERGYVLRR